MSVHGTLGIYGADAVPAERNLPTTCCNEVPDDKVDNHRTVIACNRDAIRRDYLFERFKNAAIQFLCSSEKKHSFSMASDVSRFKLTVSRRILLSEAFVARMAI